jgi:hypothetical protein
MSRAEFEALLQPVLQNIRNRQQSEAGCAYIVYFLPGGAVNFWTYEGRPEVTKGQSNTRT